MAHELDGTTVPEYQQEDHAAAGGIEAIEPVCTAVGRGSLIYVTAWSRSTRLAGLECLLDGRPVPAFFYPRAQLGAVQRTHERFAAVITIDPSTAAGSHELSIRERGRSTSHTSASARVTICEPTGAPAAIHWPEGPDEESLIAICMATYEPSQLLLARQIDSIRKQSHQRWVCLISDDGSSAEARANLGRILGDDPRFIVLHTDRRLGYYRNFERALRLVPREAALVALSDQDDDWHPDKLETLAAEIERTGAQLVYSDMRVVDVDGRLLAPTYWVERRNNFTRLASLLLANTVTGAASIFRRDLLDDVLPFPPNVGHPFHDHWIASVALASGAIAYVDRPLHDYVQHESNVVGSYVHSSELEGGLYHALKRFVAAPRSRLRSSVTHAGTRYLDELIRIELFAKTLELRLGRRVTPNSASDLRRLARLSSSLGSVLWLLGQSARDVSGKSETLGIENQLLKAILWKRARAVRPVAALRR
jgi:glycosyltransferase involved in cell wall biosynthesis